MLRATGARDMAGGADTTCAHMNRIPFPLASFLLIGLVVALTACEIMPDPEFAALKNALGLPHHQ